MPFIRLVATYDQDQRESMVIVGPQDEKGHLVGKYEMFGYSKEWVEESKTYCRYPFILTRISHDEAVADWGDWDDTKTILDVLERRLVKGEKIVRSESGDKHSYTIVGISEIAT